MSESPDDAAYRIGREAAGGIASGQRVVSRQERIAWMLGELRDRLTTPEGCHEVAAMILDALGHAPGDDILTEDDWSWINHKLYEIEERGELIEDVDMHALLASRFGEEKAEEIHEYIQSLDIEEAE